MSICLAHVFWTTEQHVFCSSSRGGPAKDREEGEEKPVELPEPIRLPTTKGGVRSLLTPINQEDEEEIDLILTTTDDEQSDEWLQDTGTHEALTSDQNTGEHEALSSDDD